MLRGRIKKIMHNQEEAIEMIEATEASLYGAITAWPSLASKEAINKKARNDFWNRLLLTRHRHLCSFQNISPRHRAASRLVGTKRIAYIDALVNFNYGYG